MSTLEERAERRAEIMRLVRWERWRRRLRRRGLPVPAFMLPKEDR